MKTIVISAFIIAAGIQAAETSLENPPSDQVMKAAQARVQATLQAQAAPIQQEMAEPDYMMRTFHAEDRHFIVPDYDNIFRETHSCCIALDFLCKKSPKKNLDPLMNAVCTGNPELVAKLLAQKPAGTTLQHNGGTLVHNAINPKVIHPEHTAGAVDCKRVLNAMHCAQLLLDYPGIDVNAQDHQEQQTALNLLVGSDYFYSVNCIPLVTKLLHKGADPYINNIYQHNVYTLLKAKVTDTSKHHVVGETLRACGAQRSVVLAAVAERLSGNTAGIVIHYVWGNLHNLLKDVQAKDQNADLIHQ